jgi:hypothetical protein
VAPAPEDGARQWYYLTPEQQQHGPLSWAELQQVVDGETHIFSEGLSDWALADEIGLGPVEPSFM